MCPPPPPLAACCSHPVRQLQNRLANAATRTGRRLSAAMVISARDSSDCLHDHVVSLGPPVDSCNTSVRAAAHGTTQHHDPDTSCFEHDVARCCQSHSTYFTALLFWLSFFMQAVCAPYCCPGVVSETRMMSPCVGHGCFWLLVCCAGSIQQARVLYVSLHLAAAAAA